MARRLCTDRSFKAWAPDRGQLLAAGNGAEDDEGLVAVCDGGGEFCVGGVVGPVFFADEEAQEGTALFGGVVADGAAELGVGLFEGVEDGAEGDGCGNVEGELVARDVGETAEVEWEIDAEGGHRAGGRRGQNTVER